MRAFLYMWAESKEGTTCTYGHWVKGGHYMYIWAPSQRRAFLYMWAESKEGTTCTYGHWVKGGHFCTCGLSRRRALHVHMGTESKEGISVHVGWVKGGQFLYMWALSQVLYMWAWSQDGHFLYMWALSQDGYFLCMCALSQRRALPVHLGIESTCTTAVGQNSTTALMTNTV